MSRAGEWAREWLEERRLSEAEASVQIDGGGYDGPDARICERCGKSFSPDESGVHTCSPRALEKEE